MIPDKKVLWAINIYSRVNHLRVQEELIRREYGDSVTINVYTGNELFDKFPDQNFKYKEDAFFRIPDDPAVHGTAGGHGGSHNGDRDHYNRLLSLNHIEGYDYVIWTAADTIFTDYSSVRKMLFEMQAVGADFMSCVADSGMGRRSHGPRVHNEFFVVSVPFYRKMCPITPGFEGYAANGDVNECMERGLGDAVRAANGKWHVVPGRRVDVDGEGRMDIEGYGHILVDNRFVNTRKMMERFCPEAWDHVQKTALKDGLLHDVRPNYC